MKGRAMKHKLPLILASLGIVIVAGLIALVTSFAYFGALLDPQANTRALPLAIVNEDAGIDKTSLGQDILKSILQQNLSSVHWLVEPNRQAALDQIQKDNAYGALVIPADYTSQVMQLLKTAGASGKPVPIDVLTNASAGSLADASAQHILAGIIDTISSSVHEQAAMLIAPASQPGAAGNKSTNVAKPGEAELYILQDPVQPEYIAIQPVPQKSARGLAPMYLAVTITLLGLLGANIVNIGIDLILSMLAPTIVRQRHNMAKSHAQSWYIKLLSAIAISAITGLIATWTIVGILGMPTNHAWELGFFTALGTCTVTLITLILVANIGIPGTLFSVLLTTIFGVPTSGGVYPLQMVPGFFAWMGSWLPMRYIVDGVRALLFFNARRDAGLEHAVWILGIYVVGVIIIGSVIAIIRDIIAMRRSRHNSQRFFYTSGLLRAAE
jgi:YhgE/Pip-like protein